MAGRRIVSFGDTGVRAVGLDGEYAPTGPTLPGSPVAPSGELATLVRSALRNADKYAVGTWYDDFYGSQGEVDVLDLGGYAVSDGQYTVRLPGMAALGLAISLTTGAYDATTTGVSEDRARTLAVRIVRSIAADHTANTTGTGWGYKWQPALWSFFAGLAGWLLWDEFTADEQTDIANMVGREADNRITQPSEFWKNAAGQVTSGRSGDSACEENSWNATVCLLAAAMMPTHRNRTLWLDRGIDLALTSFATSEDMADTTVRNGRTVASYLTSGYNANDDGTVVNHNTIHPDYIATASHNLMCAAAMNVGGLAAPLGLAWGVARSWRSMSEVVFDSPPYESPGGTIYAQDGTLYYPDGASWSVVRYTDKLALDVLVDVYGLADGSAWAALHAQKALDMQARDTTGQMYQDANEDTYQAREQWAHHLIAFAWLGLWLESNDLIAWSNASPGSSFARPA